MEKKIGILEGSESVDIEKRPNFKYYCDYMQKDCKINCFYYNSKNENRIKTRAKSLNGNDRNKFFNKMYGFKNVSMHKNLFGKYVKDQFNEDTVNPSYTFEPSIEFRLKDSEIVPSFDVPDQDCVDYAIYEINDSDNNSTLKKVNLVFEIFWTNFKRIANANKIFDEEKKDKNGKKIHEGWTEYYRMSANKLLDLKKDLKNWLLHYQDVFNSRSITPYIHIFVFHTVQLIEKHKKIDLFNCQGLEKFNDFSTINYHRATNKKNTKKSAYLQQLLQFRNRLEYYQMNLDYNDLNLKFVLSNDGIISLV